MSILTHDQILDRLSRRGDQRLVVTPILDSGVQIGLASVDLRLGTRFLVDMRTREPVIRLSPRSEGCNRPVDTFFDTTYRELGEPFVLYPAQLVLASTFEYIRLPSDLAGHLVSRSSLNRLGIAFHTLVQPGFTGTLTMELSNSTSNPVELIPGMRIAQLELHQLSQAVVPGYAGQPSAKYLGDIGPKVSGAPNDPDLNRLLRIVL